jgi:hypothetical protein
MRACIGSHDEQQDGKQAEQHGVEVFAREESFNHKGNAKLYGSSRVCSQG